MQQILQNAINQQHYSPMKKKMNNGRQMFYTRTSGDYY